MEYGNLINQVLSNLDNLVIFNYLVTVFPLSVLLQYILDSFIICYFTKSFIIFIDIFILLI